jgi:hypothetical protein
LSLLIVALLVMLAGPALASAASATLLPDADKVTTALTASGSAPCASDAKWECVNEAIPDDSDEVRVSTNGTSSFELSTTTVGTLSAVTVNVRVERVVSTNCLLGFNLKTGGGSTVATSSAASIPAAATTFTASASGLSLSQTTVDGLYVEFTTTCFSSTMAVTAISADITFSTGVAVLPNADHGSSPWSGCAAYPNMWTCVAEPLPYGYDDSDVIGAVAAGTVAAFELGTTPVGSKSDLTLNMRAISSGSCPMTYSLHLADGTMIMTDTQPLTGTATNYSKSLLSLALTQTQMDGLYVSMTAASGCYVYIVSAISLDVAPAQPPTFSGTADNTAICDGITPVVGIVVNSTKFGDAACTPGTGAFSASPSFATGDTITTYYDGVAGGVTSAGTTWVKASAASTTPITGVVLKRHEYRTEARASGTPITSVDIAKWDAGDDPDVYVTSGATLDVTDPGGQLEIGINTFRPAVTVRTPQVWVRSAGTYDAQATTVEVSNPGNSTCNDTVAYVPFCVAGTFVPGTGTVRFTNWNGDVRIAGGTYANIAIRSNAADVYLGSPGMPSTLTATSLTMDDDGGAPSSLSTTTDATSVYITGNATINSGTLQGSSMTTLTIGGNLTGAGDINLTGGTVELRGGSTVQLNASGTLPGTAWQFASLIISSTTTRNVTIPSTSREIRASVLFGFGRASDTQNTVVTATSMTRPITVTGDMVLESLATFHAPPLIEVSGDFTNNGGTFSSGTGTFRFTGTGSSTLTVGAFNQFYNFAVLGAKTVSVAGSNPVRVAISTTLTGTGCGNLATLRSSVAGTPRTWWFGTLNALNAGFKDIDANSPVTATSSVDLGGNSDITYGSNPCGSLSGVVDDLGICDGTTAVIGIAINSVKFDTVPCAPVTGAFQANPVWAAGDTITLYHDGMAGGHRGTAYVRTAAASTTDITGVIVPNVEVYLNTLSATPITATDINTWDADNDSDIPIQYPVASKLVASAMLVLNQNTFRPGVTVQAPSMFSTASATYDAQATRLELTGSGSGICTTSATARPLCLNGSFLPGTGTVAFLGSTVANLVSGGTYANIEITSSGTNTIHLTGSDDTSLTATSLTITGSGGAPVVSTSAQSPTVTITGDVTVSGTATLGGAGTGMLTIGGDISGTGLVNFTGGTVELRNAAAAQTLNASGTLPGVPWQFATLITSNSHASTARTVTIPATSREIRASTLLQFARPADTATTTLNASALTRPITATGDMVFNTRGTLTAGPTTEVDGDLTSTGTLNAGTGTFVFGGSGTSNVSVLGTGAPYNLLINTPGKEIALATNFQITHQLTFTGSCANPVTFRSSTPGAGRTIASAGATIAITGTALRDIGFTTAVTATNSGDLGNNTNVTFTGPGMCGAPSSVYTNNTNASAGTTHPTTIDGRATFHMSAVNQSGATVDRYRTDVSTSPITSSTRALVAFDGDGTDRSSVANNASGIGSPTYVAGATNFGQAAQFDGSNDYFSMPNNAAYNTSTFTVDFWMRASSYGPNPFGSLIARNNSGQFQFKVGFNASAHLISGLVTSNGGTMASVSTPADPWLDNTWHHIAFTVDASKTLRLYVDGTAYGSPVIYSGTLDVPAAPITIGGDGNAVSYYQGMLDDVQFTAGTPDPAAIAGYAATKRPHAQSIWQSASYGTTSGAALGANCSADARCADIVYGGPDIRQDGARYYATHQLRTANGLWSTAATDWFQTGDSISVVAPGTVTIPSTSPGLDATTSFNATTTCTNAGGCALQFSTPSQTIGMLDSTGSNANTVPLFTTGAASSWAPGASSGLGFTVLSSTSGKSTATWGTGVNFSNLTLLKFTGGGRTPTTLQTMPTGTETTSIGVRLNVMPTQAMGAYTGTISLVALDSP